MQLLLVFLFAATLHAGVLSEPCSYDQPICPEVEGTEQELTLLPLITDCTKYIMCQQGVPIVRPCPSTLVYNSELKVCDFANRTKCLECEPDEESK